ncbi:MAG: hypothetical protein HXX13_04300 [Bacteroidetes bacterium]|nr:hypothetical protein [Bacteroidota bacterium]
MSKFHSLVVLTNSLTLAEKKAFRIRSSRSKANSDYVVLYDIIEKNKDLPPSLLLAEFLEKRPKASIETTTKYLFELLLDTILELKKEQDSFYFLFNKILKARILYEKSMFEECFRLLDEIIEQAEKFENYYALLMASRLELDYLLALNFPDLDEATLLKKQFRLNESLKYVRKINEQSSLYENLKHRIVYKGHARSQKQKDELNDLIYSEISIVASLSLDNFEISKLHQLFQANYLISVGDYQSALNSYIELNNLFEANKHRWSNPPVYYLHTLEGVLESLRSIRNYDGMTYFVNQLKAIDSQSASFRINLTCIIFLYELFPLLDRGDFTASNALMNSYKEPLFDKLFTLNRARQAELCLYTSLIYFGNSEYHKAHKFLNQIILRGKSYYYLPLYRTIRLVNLLILYKLEDFDLIKYEIRSLKRDLRDTGKENKIERLLFKFLTKQLPLVPQKRELLLERTLREFNDIQHDVFEKQILRLFNFTAWVESILRKIPLSTVLSNQQAEHKF